MDNLKRSFAIATAFLIFTSVPFYVTAQDRRAAAEQAVAEAVKLKELHSAESSHNAIAKYEEALAIWRELADKEKEAGTLNDIGTIYRDSGDAKRSLEYFDKALVLARTLNNLETEAYTLLYAGQSYDVLGDSRHEFEFFEKALTIARQIKDTNLELSSLGSLGFAYFRLGNLENALNYYNQAMPLIHAQGDKEGEAAILVNVGAVYGQLGKTQEAIDRYLEALPIIRGLNNVQREAVILNNIGTGYSDLGDTRKAIEYYNQSLPLRRKTGDRVGEAISLSALGGGYFSLGDFDRSLDYYNQALTIQRELKIRRSEGTTLSNIGRVYLSLHDYQKALDYYSQALPIRREVGDLLGECNTLHSLAFVERESGDLNEARTYVESSIRIVESVRANLASEDLRTSYFALSQDIYKLYIDILMALGEKEPGKGYDALALQTSENARARGLLDILAEAKADIRKDADRSLIDAENDLRKQINAKDDARRRTKELQQAESIDKDIQTLSLKYEDLQTEIKRKNPHFAAISQPQPVKLAEIQKMLDADTLLLEYSLGSDNSYLWVVSQTSIKTFRLPKSSEINAKNRALYESVKNPDTAVDSQKAAAELGRSLIGPAIAELGTKRLAIVADGSLNYIPFAALTMTNTGNPLIVDHEIVYLPSATTLAAVLDDTTRAKTSKTLAVIADPVFDPSDPRVNRAASPPTSTVANTPLSKATRDAGFVGVLPRLPGTRREATTILAFATESERKRAIDFDASLATVSSPDLAQYRIVHFATHGLLNSQHPELSGIVLSLVDKDGKPQDGFLRLNDIFNLKLPADLVVLSACQTALGKEIKGEGLIGLTRGFMYAGARRVVASQWSVDDDATSELMRLFYQGMLGEKKLRPAAALREAQIAMWKTKRFAQPYYWSAFTIQGDWK